MRKYFFVKDDLYLYLFTFCIGLSVSEDYFNCTHPFREIVDDLQYIAVSCRSTSNETLLLPQNISKNIHLLFITSVGYGALMIEDVDTFKRFSNLKLIQFRMRTGLDISKSLLQRDELERLRYELFNLSTLSTVSIGYDEFNLKNHLWILPKSLKMFHLLNSVFEYDLSRCSQLEGLIVIGNKLNKLPILSNPPPPLTVLDLSKNPLREFGANDIAGYCDLRYFALERIDLSFCECVLLVEWIKINFKNVEGFEFGGVLECNYVEDSNCFNDTVQRAELLVEKCLYKGVWNTILFIISISLFIVVFALAGFLLGYSFIKLMKYNESGEE